MQISEEDHEVRYTLSPEDFTTYYEDYSAWWRKTPEGRRFRVAHLFFYFSLIAGPLACFVLLNQLTDSLGIALFTAFLVAYPWSLAVPIFYKRRQVRQMRASEGFVGQHTWRLGATGISHRNSYMEATIFWPNIKDIVVMRHYLLFVTSRSGGRHVIPIPRRAFANSEEVNAFVKRAGIYWKQAAVTAAQSL